MADQASVTLRGMAINPGDGEPAGETGEALTDWCLLMSDLNIQENAVRCELGCQRPDHRQCCCCRYSFSLTARPLVSVDGDDPLAGQPSGVRGRGCLIRADPHRPAPQAVWDEIVLPSAGGRFVFSSSAVMIRLLAGARRECIVKRLEPPTASVHLWLPCS